MADLFVDSLFGCIVLFLCFYRSFVVLFYKILSSKTKNITPIPSGELDGRRAGGTATKKEKILWRELLAAHLCLSPSTAIFAATFGTLCWRTLSTVRYTQADSSDWLVFFFVC